MKFNLVRDFFPPNSSTYNTVKGGEFRNLLKKNVEIQWPRRPRSPPLARGSSARNAASFSVRYFTIDAAYIVCDGTRYCIVHCKCMDLIIRSGIFRFISVLDYTGCESFIAVSFCIWKWIFEKELGNMCLFGSAYRLFIRWWEVEAHRACGFVCFSRRSERFH